MSQGVRSDRDGGAEPPGGSGRPAGATTGDPAPGSGDGTEPDRPPAPAGWGLRAVGTRLTVRPPDEAAASADGQLVDSEIEVGDRRVMVSDLPTGRYVRQSGDLIRVGAALLMTAAGYVTVQFGRNTIAGLSADITDLARSLPLIVFVVVFSLVQLGALVLPLVVLGKQVYQRHWRRLARYLLAMAVALVGFELLLAVIGTPNQAIQTDPFFRASGVGVPTSAQLAVLTALLTVSGPWLSRRWKRFGWVGVVLGVVSRIMTGGNLPVDVLLAIGTGALAGSVVLYLLGAPDRRPTGEQIVHALAAVGVPVRWLRRRPGAFRAVVPYIAMPAVAGPRLDVRAFGANERNADLIVRAYRYLRLRDTGDERPFTSLRRGIEHEALMSMTARTAGVRTPELRALVSVGAEGVEGVALVYDEVVGTTLDAVDEARLTDAVLDDAWAQVRRLHRRRTAHRRLRLRSFVLDDHNQIWLWGLRVGEVAVRDSVLAADVAELIAATGTRVGAERAVAAAVRVMGPAAVVDALPRLQLVPMTAETRRAVKQSGKLLDDLRTEVQDRTGTGPVKLADIERISLRRLLSIVGLGVAAYILIPTIINTKGLGTALTHAHYGWVALVFACTVVTYLGSAMGLVGAVPAPIPLLRTSEVALATTYVNRLTPAAIGGMALNVRYLQRSGVLTAVALAAVGLSQLVAFVVHIALIFVFAFWAGRQAAVRNEVPSGTTIVIAVAIVAAVIGIILAVPKLRRMAQATLMPRIVAAARGTREVLSDPLKLALSGGGAIVLNLAYIGAMWASIEAFGGGLSLPAIAVVYLAGTAVANFAPTPGGVGAIEAALIGGLTAVGLPSDVAVPAVFLYRLITFWAPVLPGWWMLNRLQRMDAI